MSNIHDIITTHFKTMKGMIEDIEIGIMQMPPEKQIEFYQPIQGMILEAWKEINGYKQQTIKNIIDNESNEQI